MPRETAFDQVIVHVYNVMSIENRPCIETIDRQLQHYEPAMRRVVKLLPDFISLGFPHDSYFPVAAVCLRDSQSTIGQALYALHRYCAWDEPQNDTEELRFTARARQRFYLEDAAMRLYSAAEDLAEAVRMMRNMPAVSGKGSRWQRVSRSLEDKDTVRQAMEELAGCREWKDAIAFRNEVVHAQPPRMAGLGRRYARSVRWSQESSGTRVLAIGSGDDPIWDSEELVSLLVSATAALVTVLSAVIDDYYAALGRRGISETSTGLSVPGFYKSI